MPKEIEKLIKEGESQSFEFKQSLGLKEEIGETVSAFSNTNDGVILIGISDSGEVIGLELGDKTLEDLANYIRINTDPEIFPQIETHRIGDKDIIEIRIKESKEKPVFFKNHAFKRVGRTNQEISAGEIRKLAREERRMLSFDEEICKDASLKDIDEEKVKEFLKTASYERRLELDTKISASEALERLGLAREEKLTNAAVLLFGKNPQKIFPQAKIKCGRFKGIKPLEFIDMKVFAGNIIGQRENAIEFVKEHIKMEAKIVGIERVERWEYPLEAIREAITNAICHRDYGIKSDAQTRIFDDRIEIWGCGPLPEPLTTEDLKREHKSILRNPLIGKSFFLIKFIEEWGTGTNRIIEWCKEYNLPEPLFEEVAGSLVVTLRKKPGEEFLREKGLNERQIKAVIYVIEKQTITNKEYQELFTVSKRTATSDLSDLVNKEIFKKIGKGKRDLRYMLK